MYTPTPFLLDDDESRSLIARRSIGTLVTHTSDGFDAAMIPFLLTGGRLLGHVAAANPIWRHGGRVLVTFDGVDGYVSPSWYPSKAEHGKVVPTWNYVTVHVHGTMTARRDTEFLRLVVAELTDLHEQRIGSTWRIDDAPEEYVERMLRAIVGVEISIDRIEGKAKLSQNRSEADIVGVVAANDNALGRAVDDARR
jgi:transcriptional regulator